MMKDLFDSHAHLDDPRFDEDREAIIADMGERGMLCVCVGSDMPTSRAAVALAQAHPGRLWASAAVHPHWAKDFAPADVEQLRAWSSLPHVVAMGEMGLDFHYDLSPRPVQREVFAAQLELAYSLDMPAILHVREAHGETIDMLRVRRDRLPPLLLHCYSGSWESAREYMDMGAMISFAGSLTFHKAANLQEAARRIPTDRLLIETDSPYLAPEPVRGRRNDPRNVAHVAAFLAALRGEEAGEVAAYTRQNALRFYRIDGTGHAL